MPNLPVMLLHGYSDKGQSFAPWAAVLREAGYEALDLNVLTYESLTNEVTIKDLAEAFDRALRFHNRLKNPEQPFDAIVHSTGMLVVRSWLAAKPERRRRLKHLLAFAPATFGSPLAQKGRSWMGALLKGNKDLGPDFLEAGNLILDGLELGSRFTWDLAHADLFGEETFYGKNSDTPYPFIFVGNEAYGGVRRIVNEPGTDGTVRWAGTPLNSRKIKMDLTERPSGGKSRVTFADWTNVDSPVIFVGDRNHGSIMSQPEQRMKELVLDALRVGSNQKYKDWQEAALRKSAVPQRQFQQFVVRLTDERGDPVPDYNIEMYADRGGKPRFLDGFEHDVHAYSRDKSYRCFHADIGKLTEGLDSLFMRLTASSGTALVGYHGHSSVAASPGTGPGDGGAAEVHVNLTRRLRTDQFQFFYPFTTTLIEIMIDREPLPFGDVANRLCRFIDL